MENVVLSQHTVFDKMKFDAQIISVRCKKKQQHLLKNVLVRTVEKHLTP